MKYRGAAYFVWVVGLLTVCIPAFAHHGLAAYDMKKTITLKATVTEFQWQNPHSELYFDVKDDNGKVVHWGCETLSPAFLSRDVGWQRTSVKPGDQITITLYQGKSGGPYGIVDKVVLSDGKVFDINIARRRKESGQSLNN